MFIARAVCGVTHVTVAALFCSSSLLCISEQWLSNRNGAGRSVSVNGNEEPRWRDLSPIQFSLNCNYSLLTHNKTLVHSTWGYWECEPPARLPVLTWVPSSVPPGNNIQDTFPAGSTQDTTQSAQHVSGDNFAHPQENYTVFTACDKMHRRCCLPAGALYHKL